ncbi:DNA-directed RNA polymerase sigma-70 factor (plasmid) [Fulvitalea axinellae]|uniref:DNA-directed RNA polymerase sigma-70 factor n=1 Tax=Fulvitalea axinellae TaxID=1182444 RepID=A0AAU9D781_9BACT|nr:DNA-directed RNA polymerase sigma-70 factor [Fulvitalea axinellae]
MEKLTASDFEEVYTGNFGSLCAYAYRLLKNYEEARELVMDVFVAFWEIRDSPPAQETTKSFLYRSVHNRAVNLLARRDVKRRYIHETTTLSSNYTDSLNEAVTYNELYGEMDKVIDDLPERCREVFELSRFSGLTHKEIAKELGLSPKTVENQIARALGKLRARLSAKGVELIGLLMAGEVIRRVGIFFEIHLLV